MEEDLLSLLRYELGEVVNWEELCPSVYYLAVQPNPDSIYPCSEYYLVLPGAPISQEALALGRPLDGIPGLLYAIDPPDEGGWTAIMYELCKNRFRHGIPPLEGWSLADAAMVEPRHQRQARNEAYVRRKAPGIWLPAQEHKWAALGKRLISVPISARITSALRRAIPFYQNPHHVFIHRRADSLYCMKFYESSRGRCSDGGSLR